MRVVQQHSCGVIIDVQEKLFPHMQNPEELQRNLLMLIRGLKALNIPTLVTEQYPKGLGPTLESVQEAFESFTPLEKVAFSCCDEEHFQNRLEELNRHMIIIAGIEAHVCVLQTVTDLSERGFIPVVVEDCTSSRRRNDKERAIARMQAAGTVVTTAESLLFELCRYSGTETFKVISKLVK